MENIAKINKINSNRILEDINGVQPIDIQSFGISKKYRGDEVSLCISGSGLPCHDKLPKFSIFETFTSDKDPIIDNINFSTIAAGLLASEDFGIANETELIFSRIIDNKGQISLSSLISGILWACIREANIILSPCSIQNKLLSNVSDLLKKINERNIMFVFPVEKNEENLKILEVDGTLGVKTSVSKNNSWQIVKEKNNLVEIFVPKNIKIYSTYGLDKYVKLYNREVGVFVVASILSALYCRHIKKKLNINCKEMYGDLSNLKTECSK